MTEEEAKTKWCPFVRLAEQEAPATVANRFVDDSRDGIWGNTLCIGSDCMAWRWNNGYPLSNDPPSLREHYQGFCGLAGKP